MKKKLSAAYRKLEWPISPNGTLSITMGKPTLSKGFVGILLNSCNEFSAMRRCIQNTAAMILSPTQLEHLIVPNIVHSTFLRFGSFFADNKLGASKAAQFRRNFEAAAEGWSPVIIRANRVRLVRESIAYMQMQLPPDTHIVSGTACFHDQARDKGGSTISPPATLGATPKCFA